MVPNDPLVQAVTRVLTEAKNRYSGYCTACKAVVNIDVPEASGDMLNPQTFYKCPYCGSAPNYKVKFDRLV